jgi:hypothetical protein
MRNKELKRLAFCNRQPTLWRHSMPAIEIIPLDNDEDETISLSPLMLEPLNADFDGDTLAIYLPHDEESQKEINEKAFIKNYVTYDQDGSFLATVRHEALYACFILTEDQESDDNNVIHINTLQELPESFDYYNNITTGVYIKDIHATWPYGYALLNKWCGFDKILIDQKIVKGMSNYISSVIYDFHGKNSDVFYTHLTNLNKNLLFFISSTVHAPTINIKDMMAIVDEDTRSKFKKIPSGHAHLGYHINEALVDKCLDNCDKTSQLYKLFKSGSRFSKTQLARSCINIGYCADDSNNVVDIPIRGNLMEGITEDDFFLGAPGTRKAIADKSDATPDSGHLERTLVMALSPLECIEDDCNTSGYLEFEVQSKKHAETIVGKYYRLGIHQDWTVLDETTAISLVGQTIQMRSPMTCVTPNFRMCRKCFGDRQYPTKYLGISAGQNVTERFTQLTMRTFHESGAASLEADKESVNFLKYNLVDVQEFDDIIKVTVTNINQCPDKLKTMSGFIGIEEDKIVYQKLKNPVANKDTISTLNAIRDLLKTQKKSLSEPKEYYTKMMKHILEVGKPYSSFVEMLFANMFMTDIKTKQFWRYNQGQKVVCKLGDKTLAAKLSPLLGLLFTPNARTIDDVGKIDEIDLEEEHLTIYERIFLEMF